MTMQRSGGAWKRRGGVFMLRWCALVVVPLLILGSARAADGQGFLAEGMSLNGGVLQLDSENKVSVITNYGEVNIGDLKITARNMVFFHETREVYAEGNVLFAQKGGSTFECEKLFFNIADHQGTAIGVRIKAQQKKKSGSTTTPSFIQNIDTSTTSVRQPTLNTMFLDNPRAFVQAKEMRIYGPKRAEMIGVMLSPSAMAKKPWGIGMKAATVVKNEKIEAWHNFLKIGPVPVFYFPYIIRDLKYEWPWMRVSGGNSTKWGASVNTEWALDLNPNPESWFRMNKLFYEIGYRQRRGMNFGLGGDYKVGKLRSGGSISLDVIDESMTTGSDDRGRANLINHSTPFKSEPNYKPDLYAGDTRWIFHWWHSQQLNEKWDVRGEAHLFSDPDVYFEYDENRFKNDKFPPETWIGLRRLRDDWIFEIVAQKQVNSYLSQSERLPEIRITLPGLQLAKTNLYLESDTRMGFVNRHVDTTLDRYNRINNDTTRIKSGDKTDTFFRLINVNKLKMPITLGSTKFVPYVGNRVAWHSKQYGKPGGDSSNTDELSASILWGFDWSTRLYKTYNEGAWRHVIEPTISFSGNEKPDTPASQLYPIDRFDSYSEEHFWTFALNQKLQKKIGKSTRDVIDFDVGFRLYPLKEESERRNFGRTASEVTFDLIWHPTRKFTTWANVLYDPKDNRLNQISGGFDLIVKDRIRLYLTHFRLKGDTFRSPGSAPVALTTAAMRIPLWNKDSHYSLELAGRYDHESVNRITGLIEKRVTIYRDFDTFDLAVSVTADEKALGDKGVFLTISPKFGGQTTTPLTNTASGASNEWLTSRYSGNPKASEPNGDEDEEQNLPPAPIDTHPILNVRPDGGHGQ